MITSKYCYHYDKYYIVVMIPDHDDNPLGPSIYQYCQLPHRI